MKSKLVLPIVLILLVLSGCNPYHRVIITGSDFYGRNKVIKNIDKYDIYVHEADSVYQIQDPVITDRQEIKGVPVSVDSQSIAGYTKNDTSSKLTPQERDDIHFYVEKAIPSEKEVPADSVLIDQADLKEVEIGARKKMGVLGIVLTIILSVFLFFLLLIIVLVAAVASSDSGGSESGGSDSGGSDSDSGCYIATMAYGSYEAPKVMVLRRFRDRFLERFSWGRAFIAWYYRNSPGFVEKHRSKQWLHVILRKMLDVFVFILNPFYKN